LAPGAAAPGDRGLAAFGTEAPYAALTLAGEAESYPYGVATPTSIELYFEVAPGAFLDRLSIMDSFGVSATNDAMSFSASGVVLAGVDYAALHGPWAAYAVARVDGTLTNNVDTGVITFTVSSGFKDSAGNETSAAQSLPLVK
jgi:hypothetical protein